MDLEDNPIRVKGATAFAEMLLKNKSLKELNLKGAKIGEEGAKKLNESLTYNKTVRLFPKSLVMDKSDSTDELNSKNTDSTDELNSEESDSTEESDSEGTDSTDESDSTDQPHLS